MPLKPKQTNPPMTEEELNALIAEEQAGAVAPADPSAYLGYEPRTTQLSKLAGVGVAPGGVEAPYTRFQASRISRDRIEEKMLSVMSTLGLSEEDVLAVPDPDRPPTDPNNPLSGGETILVRLPGAKDYVELDPPDFERVADMVDMMAPFASLETLLSVVGLAIPAVGGMGLTARMLGSAAGAGVGMLTESELERMFGIETTPRADVLGQAAQAAGMAAVGEAGGEVLHGASAVFQGTLRGTPGAVADIVRRARMRAPSMPGGAELIGPAPADIPPFLKSIQGQAARMHLPAQRREIDKFYGYLQMLEQRAKAIRPDVPTARLQEVADQWAKELESRAQGPLKTTYLRAGKAAARGAQAFWEVRKRLHDRLFNDVRRLAFDQGVEFNIGQYRIRMEQLLRGELGQSATEETGVQVIMRTDPALARELLKLYDLPDSVKGALATVDGKQVALSAYDALKDIRTNLYNLGKMTDPRQERIRAITIDMITDTMQNPVGGNAEFRTALRKAETAFKTTQRVMDISLMRESVKRLKNRPESVGRLLINSNEPLKARAIRAMFSASERAGELDPAAWEQVKKGYYTRVLETPSQIPKEIARWRGSEGQGRYFLTDQDEESLKGWYRFWKAHQSGPVGKFVEETTVLGNAEFQKLLDLPQRELQDLLSRSGGKSGPLGTGLRAALWRRLLDGARTEQLGVWVLSRNQYIRHFNAVRESGLADLVFTPGEIDDAMLAFELSSLAPDIGFGEGLITAGKGASLAATPHDPKRGAKAMLEAKTTALISFIFTNKFARSRMRAAVGGKDMGAMRKVGIVRPLGIAAAMAMKGIEDNAAAYYGAEAEPSGPSIELRPDELINMIPGLQYGPEKTEQIPELKPFQP